MKIHFILFVLMLLSNVLLAQSKYKYASTWSQGQDSVKYNWVKIEGRNDEQKMSKLEIQQVDKSQFSAGIQGLIFKFEHKGWELFYAKKGMIYFRKLKK